MEQAGEGSRIIKGLGNKRREFEVCKGMRKQEGEGSRIVSGNREQGG